MTKNPEKFQKRVVDIAVRAGAMAKAVVTPQFDKDSQFIQDPAQRVKGVAAALTGGALMLASSGVSASNHITPEEAVLIAPIWAQSVQDYEAVFGQSPSEEMFASAHQVVENILKADTSAPTATQAGMMLASAVSTSKTDGILERARVIAMVLPVFLRCATNDAVTLIPAGKDVAEIFRVHTIAGTTSGELTKGEVIAEGTVKQFSQQRQRYEFVAAQQPDGTKKDFTFTSVTDLPSKKAHKIKLDTSKILVNRKPVAKEIGGQFIGIADVGGTNVTFTCSVDHDTGVFTVNTGAETLADGVKLHVIFEIDIENAAELIPKIQHKMSSVEVRPFEVAMGSELSIQAMHKMQREHGVDSLAMLVSTMTNLVSYETDTRRLLDMTFYASAANEAFNKYTAPNAYFKEVYEQFGEYVSGVSKAMLAANKKSGIKVGYAGSNASTFIQALPSNLFTPNPSYVQSPQLNFLGTLRGGIRIYEVPFALPDLTTDQILWCGKGQNHGDAGYIAGTAIPVIMHNHETQTDLIKRNTLWGSEYGELHPDNGEAYFIKSTIVDTAPV
ncbi:hypothetical protein KO527_05395 [Pseudoalteromonas sp. C2R02]|uniref:hypothetical protein n=1 Tax=Pseudoalteromonas sp. C2R02 TaxID=2841565 RepID=UPI001C0A2E05|nr:hypothetical protein [Pseudoalteromonas sp. C2R02]MBU2968783.1 hypothetical protein [Pseudoalteromonas sp. C2R02]